MKDLGCKLLYKTAVVTYKNYGAAKIAEGLEEYVLGMKVKVVGRLV